MTADTSNDARAVPAWLAGGILLIAGGILPVAVAPEFPFSFLWAQTLPPLLFLIALILFALPRRTSIVGDSRLGKTAVMVFATMQFLALPMLMPFWGADRWVITVAIAIYWIVLLGAAGVAGFSIARARVVPPPWNWAPLIGLAVLLLPYVFTIIPAPESSDFTGMVYDLIGIVTAVVVCGLGVLAVVLAFTARLPASESMPVAASAAS